MAGFALSLLLPPIIAILLYALFIYGIIPLYRRRQRYTQYIPVSLEEDGLLSRTRDRAINFASNIPGANLWSRRSSTSADSIYGDEELEEGDYGTPGANNFPREQSPESDGRRLSRELEVGFRDDSDDEEDEHERRRGNPIHESRR